MTLSVTIGAVNQTSFVMLNSMTLRFNTLDLALKNPATTPALGNTVTLVDPAWTGTVTSINTTDLTKTYDVVGITATNTDVAGASAGPFGLSDGSSNYGPFSDGVLALTPAAYWRFGEPSGTTAINQMGSNHGNYVNTPTLGVTGALAGDLDTSITVNGTNEYVSVVDAAELDLGDVFTLSAWIKKAGSGYRGIMSKGTGAYYIRLNADDTVSLLSANTAMIATTTTTVGAGWTFVVATKNGAAVHLYLNGVDYADTVTTGVTTGNTATALNIGRESGSGTEYFSGSLDEPALWNRALTQPEVMTLYTAGANTPTYSYSNMSVTLTDNLDATTTTTGSCTIQHAGLWPAMTFLLTNANRGYAAQSFSVTDVTVTWPTKAHPVYRIGFGDPIVTMSVWVASKIADVPDGSISGTKITDLSVTTPKLAANAVTAAKITAGTITTTEIANGTITGGDIAGTTITGSNIVTGTITTTQIAANTITAGDIAAGTITTTELAANTIVAGDIAAGTITSTEIANGTITGGDIAGTTITGSNIVTGTITTTQIAANTITAGDIAAGTITANEIAAGTITADELDSALIFSGTIEFNGGQVLRGDTGNQEFIIDADGASIPTSVRIRSTSGQTNFLSMGITGATESRLGLRGDATTTGIGLGPGTGAAGVWMKLAGTKTVSFDDYTGGSVTVNIIGTLTATGNVDVDSALRLGGGTSAIAGGITFKERSGVGNAPTNEAVLYIKDNGAGKTQLVVVFQSGATQVIATEP